ncbi:hypothetical protein J7E97_06485 [Streptomyces sp. ISL-66]|uniref:hypothetical protein n=1 Tax=Streptomyces sp. ISL-66 TaxID=2819186 RepID=UPI001BEC8963|nr:hypothetical protein [Streptomyces sp. ISL-66]MBT2467524.1 hypothetical protein [Streptomyces sp. ISL-66]
MLTRTATYPDRETAQWATQEVITRNEQTIHRWLAQATCPVRDAHGVSTRIKYGPNLNPPFVVVTSMPE